MTTDNLYPVDVAVDADGVYVTALGDTKTSLLRAGAAGSAVELTISAKDGKSSRDSVAADEYAECLLKAQYFTGAREPILTKALFKRVAKARRRL